MSVQQCERCGFPMLRLMSSKPNSTETVYACVNCRSEQAIGKASYCQPMNNGISMDSRKNSGLQEISPPLFDPLYRESKFFFASHASAWWW